MELYKECMNHTGRTYPDGYGFAIIYCKDAGNFTTPLYKAACKLVEYAFSNGGRIMGFHNSPDLVRFVSAVADSKDYRDWLIEGCQLVLSGALHRDYPTPIKYQCSMALAMAGHSGYTDLIESP